MCAPSNATMAIPFVVSLVAPAVSEPLSEQPDNAANARPNAMQKSVLFLNSWNNLIALPFSSSGITENLIDKRCRISVRASY